MLFQRNHGAVANAAQRSIKLVNIGLHRVHVPELVENMADDAVGDVLEQATGLLHFFPHDLVYAFVIYGSFQVVRIGGGQQICADVHIYAVFVAYFLLLVVLSVLGKKLNAFERDLNHVLNE